VPDPSPHPQPKPSPRFAHRIANGLRQRLLHGALWVDRYISRLPADTYINLRWPTRKPFQLPSLDLASYGGGLGDELMITPALRAVKKRNPTCHIRFHSRYPDLFRLYPFIDEIIPLKRGTLPAGARLLRYAHLAPPTRTLTHHLAEQLGLNIRHIEPEPPPIPASLQNPTEAIPSPRIVIQPGGSGWTPNKQWPIELWCDLISLLLPHAHVIEAGTAPAFGDRHFGTRFSSTAGSTSVLEFAAQIRDADLFIGQGSAGMHLAGAYGVPSIVIFGGYERPEGIGYPSILPYYIPVPCAPCWLTTPCPHALKCMHAIRPEAVAATALQSLRDRNLIPVHP